jgi:LSU ribosomal protein L4P
MELQTDPRSTDSAFLQVKRYDMNGRVVGEATLDKEVFGVHPNIALMHQVVTAQLAAARAGTHSTRTRAEVRGGGAKPFRQKGTGRARQGSIRAPHFTGGGVAHGPKPRDYRQHTPKKMIQAAVRSALSDRAQAGRIRLVEELDFERPSTKRAKLLLDAIGVGSQVLVVLSEGEIVAAKSFSNLPEVQHITVEELNTYDILANEWLVFNDSTLHEVEAKLNPNTAYSNQHDADGGDR